MNIHKSSLGVRFDMIASPITMELERWIWEEVFSVLTVFDVSGLSLYGGIVNPAGENIYMCVFTGGSLTQMRRIFNKLDNDAGVSMYLASTRPFIQKNELAGMPDLPFLGRVQHSGKLAGGKGLPVLIPKKHGKRRPVGRGIKIMLAPDDISASLPSMLAIKRLTVAARKHFPGVKVVPVPITHGGAGTVDSAVVACNGVYRYTDIREEDGAKRHYKYGVLYGRTGIIEAVPGRTSTGTGELIRRVLDEGLKDIVIGMGTWNAEDCGIGCARALGVKFFDSNDNELSEFDVDRIRKIDTEYIHSRIAAAQFTIMRGVNDGSPDESSPSGYPELIKLVNEINGNTAGENTNISYALLSAILNAKIKPSTEALFDSVDFNALVKGVALIVTGEGRLTEGKSDVTGTILRSLSGRKVPIAVISDCMEPHDSVDPVNIGTMYTINSLMDKDEAVRRSEELFDDAADRMFRFIRIGRDVERIGAPKKRTINIFKKF
ncbi:MAG: Glycerate kinase [Firmicutes bacterium ADurb.Bin182]|nr:MAG: Glycerate kinase [Firmicutes bacterium ADurb.Bin182]